MIVIDASLALELAFVTPLSQELERRMNESGRELAAPEIIDLEFLQALRRLLRLKLSDQSRAKAAIGVFSATPIQRFSHLPLQTRIWSLRDNLTAYDAAYFALAEMLDAPLWTRDTKFRAAPWHRAKLFVM